MVLAPGESTSEDFMLFRKWVHRTRRLRNYDYLQASFHEKDVRVERRLRFVFAKRKASGKVRQAFHQTLPHGLRHLPRHPAALTNVSRAMYRYKVRAVALLLTLSSQQLLPGSAVRLASPLLIHTIKSVNGARAVLPEGHLILPRVL